MDPETTTIETTTPTDPTQATDDRGSGSGPQTTPPDATAACPECAGAVAVGDRILHELVECPDCASPLEVTALSPPAVELAPLEEEDWGE